MVLNPIKQIWKNLINESNARNLVKNSPEKKKKTHGEGQVFSQK